jgi:hypothetical protein
VIEEAQKKHLEYVKLDYKYRSLMTEKEAKKKREEMKKNPTFKGINPLDREFEPVPTPEDIPFIYGTNKVNLIPGKGPFIDPKEKNHESTLDFGQKELFKEFGDKTNIILRSVNFVNMGFTTGPKGLGISIINFENGKTEGKINQKFSIIEFGIKISDPSP